LRRKLLEKAL